MKQGEYNNKCKNTCPFNSVHKLEEFAIYELLNNQTDLKPVLLCCAEANNLVCKNKTKCKGKHGIQLTSHIQYPTSRCKCYLFGVGCTKLKNMSHEEPICLAYKTVGCNKGTECNDIHIKNGRVTHTKTLLYPGPVIRITGLNPEKRLCLFMDNYDEDRRYQYLNTMENKESEPINPAISATASIRCFNNMGLAIVGEKRSRSQYDQQKGRRDERHHSASHRNRSYHTGSNYKHQYNTHKTKSSYTGNNYRDQQNYRETKSSYTGNNYRDQQKYRETKSSYTDNNYREQQKNRETKASYKGRDEQEHDKEHVDPNNKEKVSQTTIEEVKEKNALQLCVELQNKRSHESHEEEGKNNKSRNTGDETPSVLTAIEFPY
jgi:hypothetical protein